MTNMLTLTGPQILAIPANQPERLFGKPEFVADRYKILAKRWHPDHAGGDNDVFAQINVLHVAAKKLIEAGAWHVPGELEFTSNGKSYVLKYFKSFDFELGKGYLGNTTLTYVIGKDFADLAEHARKIITDFTFPDKEREDLMKPYLPKLKGYYETADSVVLMIEKPFDLIRLRDAAEIKRIDPRHVAWIVSRMLYHASYLEWANLTHNDFSLDTLFICPEHHSVCLLGGWWYAAALGQKPLALSQRTINNAPSELISTKKALFKTDLELIRLTAREALGNASGIHLTLDKDVPPAFTNWLRLPGTDSAIKDYKYWDSHVLVESFGPKKFVEMPISASTVYQV